MDYSKFCLLQAWSLHSEIFFPESAPISKVSCLSVFSGSTKLCDIYFSSSHLVRSQQLYIILIIASLLLILGSSFCTSGRPFSIDLVFSD